jgi:hypothetical protein
VQQSRYGWRTIASGRLSAAPGGTCSVHVRLRTAGRYRLRLGFTPDDPKRFSSAWSMPTWVVVRR